MFNLLVGGGRRRAHSAGWIVVDKVAGPVAWEFKRFFRKLFSKWEDQDS